MSQKKQQPTKRKSQPAVAPKKTIPTQNPDNQALIKFLPYLGLAAALLFVLFVRLNLLGIPLERDEGGFAYIAQQTLQGQTLYTDLHDIKLPGLYYTYAAFISIFGETPQGVHTGLLLFNLGGVLVLFFLLRMLYSDAVAATAASVYAFLSVSPNLLGFAAHATQLLLLPALGGIFILIKGLQNKKWYFFLFAGLLLGYAFTIKQQAVYFMLFAGIFLLFQRIYRRQQPYLATALEVVSLIVGSLLPYLLIVAQMQSSGRFEAFWFWTFEWPREFGTNKTFSESVGLFQFMFPLVLKGQGLIWLLAALGMATTSFLKISLDKKLFAFLLFALLCGGVATGFHFYQHYFVMLLPAIGLLVGLFLKFLNQILKITLSKWISVGILSIALLQIVVSRPDYFSNPNFTQILRAAYGTNPFPEAIEIGHYLKSIKKDGDKMVVFGSEPEIPFYANLPSVTGHVFIYPLTDGGSKSKDLQTQMIQAVEQEKPRFLVFVQSVASWLAKDTSLETWMRQHVTNDYRPIGMVDIFGGTTPTNYVWGFDQASRYQPQAQTAVYIFERKIAEEND